jgi:CDP-glucose 4,6-dehydratase
VFVTGHTGFKGSWLCLLLDSLGARVKGYALDPPTRPSLYSLARVDELAETTTGDVRDLELLSASLSAFAPEVVFHMAAQSVVLRSHEDPVETYSTNVLGTVHVLEAVRRMRRPCSVVNVTTDKCYDNRGWVWGYRETDALGGRDPYSSSKSCAELVGDAYRASFFPMARLSEHGVRIASARAGNVVGGGDWTARQLIPEAVAAFLDARPVALRRPDAVRPWQHVLDCLAGYLRLAEQLFHDAPSASGAWNFGPAEGDAWPVRRVVELMGSLFAMRTPWVPDAALHVAEERELRLDASKAAAGLGWRCILPTEEALRWVVFWYRQHQAGKDPRALCHEQIAEYAARARRVARSVPHDETVREAAAEASR